MGRKYAIDANIFISASRLYYPFDVAPAFWKQLLEKGADKVILIDRICDEIFRGGDQLSQWLRENRHEFCLRSSQDPVVIASYREIISNVSQNLRYTEAARRQFATVADSWVCAHSLAWSYTVVTEEIHEPARQNRIKIPDVCVEFGIDYIDRLQFIRQIGIVFE
ncbi:MAG TPA: DUF4411 family protein [Firmicutes bacterium]|nr:DUF4411 family protein [Bacillota bacterium]